MIKEQTFGKAKKFLLSNSNGVSVSILNYGGIVQSILLPNENGLATEVALGFDDFTDYEKGHPYFGAIVGRYGNRIAGGKFELEGETYQLAVNNGPNHLHGGIEGFDKKFWDAVVKDDQLILTYFSPHMEEGFPGNLKTSVTYLLDDDNRLHISYRAETDRPTIINLTNHTYFNLTGRGDVMEHELMMIANEFTPVDKDMIPTGEFRHVEGSVFDFRSMKSLGKDINQEDEQLKFAGGYDHNFVLRNPGVEYLAARIYEPESGRTLEVYTDEPGIQLYTGNFLEGNYNGRSGNSFGKRTGFCLETQHFPDTPNKSMFPSTVLKENEIFRSKTVYQFGF